MLDEFLAAAEAAGAVVKRYNTVASAVGYIQNLGNAGGMLTTDLPPDIMKALPLASLPLAKDAAHASFCISFAKAGIAATGSLLLDVSDPVKRSYTALPPVHVVFVRASSLVADFYALHDILAHDLSSPQTAYLSITTGPSRTADIERVLTIGVHGPKELHVLVLEGE